MQYLADYKVANLPSTPWKLCLSLFQGKYTPHELWKERKFRLKFLLRSLLMPLSTHKLLKLLTEHPHYEKLLLAQPRLPCRLHRPYLSNRLSRRDGVQAITYHYQIINEVLKKSAFIQHLNNSLCLAEFHGKDNSTFHLNFVSSHKLDREGEASLVLRNGEGDMLCEMTFTICEREALRALMIGGVQGPNGENAQEKVHLATKSIYGIFPKKLVFEALVTIAKICNITSIVAVSNETHVYRSLRYHSRQKKIHASYSSFWEMMGGVLSKEGYYELQCGNTRKDIESIPSKKRAEYRRRFHLIDDMNNKINNTLISDIV